MEDKKQGSKLGEIMDLADEFLKKAEIIYKKNHREIIKKGTEGDARFNVVCFGLACVTLQSKMSDWMQGMKEEMDILQKEESSDRTH